MDELNDFQENYITGWIKLYRSIRKHWLWTKGKPLSKIEAWITIIMECNHTDNKVLIYGELIDCKRGQSLNSLNTWSKLFNWSIQSTRTFLTLLKNDSMINMEGLRKTTRLTVCNYDKYQGDQHTNNTQTTSKQHTANTQLTTNNNDKNVNNYKKEINKEKFLLIFDSFRKKYPGTKRSNETEFDNFIKKHEDWEDVIIKLESIIDSQIRIKQQIKTSGKFVPNWKNLQTWINNRCWEEELSKEKAISTQSKHLTEEELNNIS